MKLSREIKIFGKTIIEIYSSDDEFIYLKRRIWNLEDKNSGLKEQFKLLETNVYNMIKHYTGKKN